MLEDLMQRTEERILALDRAVAERDWQTAATVCGSMRYALESLAKGREKRERPKSVAEAVRERKDGTAAVCDQCRRRIKFGEYMIARRNTATGETRIYCSVCEYKRRRDEIKAQQAREEKNG